MADSSAITLDQIQHVAALARLTVTDEEAQTLTQDLGKILGYVKKLDELDTAGVPATAHAIPLPTVLRDDTVARGLPVDKGLADAPERLGDGFGVPKIID